MNCGAIHLSGHQDRYHHSKQDFHFLFVPNYIGLLHPVRFNLFLYSYIL
ncbi:hypothetical protein LEP1GSC096_1640 [Leptospira interrogans serovar Hebdomadis str. R499]|nr:hypothetical protein LEP1GSC096_1640 [Leptospira interrogans serovar Hebdomadis str. R499]EMJ50652.1 hypothetical protein LEP1GSC111_4309 [Leptospira interrogans str. UT126]EMN64980.1 hypothetical protein LEP1GSC098_2157 [Leptospira interrogans serovar Grippotyphosa str. UI 08434]EMY55456.1 hypothetical protein LEP1GSC204_0029 [Leptospira interrogans serovar Copenhageni str. M20]